MARPTARRSPCAPGCVRHDPSLPRRRSAPDVYSEDRDGSQTTGEARASPRTVGVARAPCGCTRSAGLPLRVRPARDHAHRPAMLHAEAVRVGNRRHVDVDVIALYRARRRPRRSARPTPSMKMREPRGMTVGSTATVRPGPRRGAGRGDGLGLPALRPGVGGQLEASERRARMVGGYRIRPRDVRPPPRAARREVTAERTGRVAACQGATEALALAVDDTARTGRRYVEGRREPVELTSAAL